MRTRVPVLAATTGGPIESVQDGKTGWLRDTTDVTAWSDVMTQALGLTDNQVRAMGEAGTHRVRELFGRDKMAERLDEILDEMMRGAPTRSFLLNTVLNAIVVAMAFAIGLVCAKGYYTAKEAVIRAWGDIIG